MTTWGQGLQRGVTERGQTLASEADSRGNVALDRMRALVTEVRSVQAGGSKGGRKVPLMSL